HGPLVKLLHESKAYNASAMERSSLARPDRNTTLRLSEYETVEINKLLHAMNLSFIEENQVPVLKTTNNIYDVFLSAELHINLIIQFCTRLSSFNSLNGADQLTILKRFFLDLSFIRGSFQ